MGLEGGRDLVNRHSAADEPIDLIDRAAHQIVNFA
jgi:hypothetical protein